LLCFPIGDPRNLTFESNTTSETHKFIFFDSSESFKMEPVFMKLRSGSVGKRKRTLESNTAPRRPPASIPLAYRPALNVLSVRKIEKIYFDLHQIAEDIRRVPATYDIEHVSPFTPKRRLRWPEQLVRRYAEADSSDSFGREYLVIVMFSTTFLASMAFDNDETWSTVKAEVEHFRHSLRMFAIVRKIQVRFTLRLKFI